MSESAIAERAVDDVTVLALSGHFVLGEGEVTLRERIVALLARGRNRIVLNLHDVTYLDSCGIGALVEEFRELHKAGGDLRLVCPSQRCERVLALTHLLPVFEVYDSDEAAVASFGRDRLRVGGSKRTSGRPD